jgi:hypothetical protein
MDCCLYADVYGFSALVREDVDATAQRLVSLTQKCTAIVNRVHAGQAFSTHLSFFSDNLMMIFKTVDVDESQPNAADKVRKNSLVTVQSFLVTCGKLYSCSIEENLPFRGAVAVGDISVSGNQFLGSPIIRAVEFEKRVRLPLIFLPEAEIQNLGQHCSSEELQAILNVASEDIEFSDGLTAAIPIIPAKVEPIIKFALEHYSTQRINPLTSKSARDWKNVHQLLAKMKDK